MTHPEAMRKGFLGYDSDPVDSRLIMLVDPTVIDVRAFRVWVDGVAIRANRAAHVRGAPLRVTVQAGCFSAAEVLRVRDYLVARAAVNNASRGTADYLNVGGWGLNVDLDSRFHITVYPGQIQEGKRLQRKFGPVVALDYDTDRPQST